MTIPYLKTFYRVIVVIPAWYCYRDRQGGQYNRLADQEIRPHTSGHLIFDKEAKNIQ